MTERESINQEEGFVRMRGRSLERVLIVTGFSLFAGLILELVLITVASRQMGFALWRGLAVEMVAGREAGIPLSLGGGAAPWLVAQLSAVQDIAVVCIAYPVLLYVLHRYRDRDNMVMRRLRRIQSKANEHRRFVQRWGPVGVFLFMLVPFLVNGPLSGALVGRLAGIPTRYLLVPVVASTVVAAAAWSYSYDTLFRLTNSLHPAIAPAVSIGIVVLLVGWMFVSEALEARRRRAEAGPRH